VAVLVQAIMAGTGSLPLKSSAPGTAGSSNCAVALRASTSSGSCPAPAGVQFIDADAFDVDRLAETPALHNLYSTNSSSSRQHHQRRGAHGAEDVEHLIDAGVEGRRRDARAAPQQAPRPAKEEVAGGVPSAPARARPRC
jgi:hypothetical protein